MSNNDTMNLGERLEQGILLARKRMLREKSLRGQEIVLGDGNGGIVRVSAKEVIAAHDEYL